MTRYFTLGLYSEGPTDRPFLERILHRSLVDILTTRPRGNSAVQEQFVRFGRKPPGRTRADFIVDQVQALQKEVTIIFVHADGAGDPDAALANNCNPAIDRINAIVPGVFGVAVVPVRETEAWALADIEAVKLATGGRVTSLSKRNPEKILDPKAELKQIQRVAGALNVHVLLADLADSAKLSELRKVKSFAAMESRLVWQLERIAALAPRATP